MRVGSGGAFIFEALCLYLCLGLGLGPFFVVSVGEVSILFFLIVLFVLLLFPFYNRLSSMFF